MSSSKADIELIVGLGNIGPQYADTRHNAGFWFVEELAQRGGGVFRQEARFHGELAQLDVDGRPCRVLKPGTLMNRSGQSVGACARFFKLAPEQLVVVHDELDLPAGVVRLKFGGGHGGHNGLRDLVAHLGTRDFYRLRIGIGRPPPGQDVVGYVLGRPSKADVEAIEDAIDQAFDALPLIMAGEMGKAMQRLNTR